MALLVPKKIIVHHSLTKDSGTVSWGAIRNYHVEGHKWDDIGYHAGVELVKSGYQSYFEALMGRMWDIRGAHTKGQNYNSLGICFMGNFEEESPKRELMRVGAKVIALWLKLFNLKLGDVYPHNYFNPQKLCPGALFDMEFLKMLVQKIKEG